MNEADEWGYRPKLRQFCDDDCRDAYRKTSKRNVCPECTGPIYAKGDTRTQGRPKKFCSEKCKNTFDGRRESRAVQLYDLMMGKRRDQDAPDWDKIQRTITRLRDRWDREDYRPLLHARQKTWYDWHRLIPEDLLAGDISRPPAPGPGDPEFDRQRQEQLARALALHPQPIPDPKEVVPPPSSPAQREVLSGSLMRSLSPRIVVEKRKRLKPS